MKKVIAVMSLLAILAGCMSEPEGPPASTCEVKEQYYEVYNMTKHGRLMYQYFIVSGDHQKLDDGITYAYPQITKSGDLIKLSLCPNEYLSCCRYYDISSSLMSRWFMCPMADNGKLIVYPDEPPAAKKLIVQDIFDKTKYYLEIKRDISYYPIDHAEFTDDGKQLLIGYTILQGQYVESAAETIDLY